ncbi:MAG: 50S ribosomal protein L21 [Armatimonadetes bacterium]|nr:50S ribosomal protein L21 [Armatimonadota bacterium]
MYAIIRTGGRQYRVEEKQRLQVEKLDAEPGATIEVTEVLALGGDGNFRLGQPLVDGAKVTARVVRQFKGPKINGFTYKPKKHQSRRYGHRQQLTELVVESIQG